MPSALKWVGLALLGLVAAAAITVAANSLASRPIGLQSQPLSVSRKLAPAPAPARRTPTAPPPQRTRTVTTPGTTTAPARGDDGGGHDSDGDD